MLLAVAACGRLEFTMAPDRGDGGSGDGSGSGNGDGSGTAPTPDVWFKLDESSGQIAADSVGALHGWVGDPGAISRQSPGVQGGAIQFTGAPGSYVMFPSADGNCPVIPAWSGSLTLATWVRFGQFDTWNNFTLSDFAISHGSSGGAQGGWGLGATDACGPHVIGATLTPPADNARVIRCGATPLAAGAWYHIASVYDASARTLDVYLNGVLDNGSFVTAAPVPGSIHVPTDACPFIASPSNQYNLLVGSLDDVRIYRRTLTADEIASIHDANGT